jgi:uncharacterized membrane-anchored protein YhcB (DUF1043 family)
VVAASQTANTLSSIFAAVVGALAAVSGALVSLVVARRSRKTVSDVEGDASQTTLEERLDELSKSMRQSARLVEQVSAELDARAASARQLQEDAKTAEALAALHKDQADAIRRTIDAELASTAKRIRSDSIKIGIASFVAGGGLTLVVTLFVHPFH